ncbi:MAG: hypothetical protein FWC71_02910 [Defluviitaleaceae bacterium]|nr:hypothetical protein [Defluviitaleaceae bacterium]
MGVVILMLILFWPIGLILLFVKLTSDKRTVLNVNCHRPLSRFSFFILFLIACFIVIQLMGIIDDWIGHWNHFARYDLRASELAITFNFTLYPLVGILTVLFVILRLVVVKMKRDALRLKRYIPLIANDNMRNVNEISNALRLSPRTVTQDLRKLCGMGVFPNLFFNPTIGLLHDRVAHPQHRPPMHHPAPPPLHHPVQPQLPPVPQHCPNCGARTNPQTRNCEYCGSMY